MATYILVCEKCKSKNIKDLNGDLKNTAQSYIVYIKAKCEDCNFEFEYPSATKHGRRMGILY